MIEAKMFNYPEELGAAINLNKENISKYMDHMNVTNIKICDLITKGDKYKYIYTDMDHPVTYSDYLLNRKSLNINSDFLKQNPDYINEMIIETIKGVKGELSIWNTELITPNVIDAIAANTNITEVTLGRISDIYYLDKNTYDKLNNGHIKKIMTDGVDKSLENNFDDIIDYNINKIVVDGYSVKAIKETERIILNHPIKDEDLEFLKYSKDGIQITLQFDDYSQLFNQIEKIEQLNKNYKYNVYVNSREGRKEEFNQYLFSNIDKIPNNVNVCDFLYTYPLNEYLENEKFLYQLIEPATDLSNFEKYLYAYNIVKHFKKYKEAQDKLESRDLYKVINNDEYMVCVGYANLLIDLVNKLNINAYYYGVGVDAGFDNVDAMAENVDSDNESKYAGHARVIVNLNDPKYNIDGIYIADPTWDNVLDEDSYIYSALTFDEISHTKRYNYYDRDVTGLLFSNNIEQFYQSFNALIDKYNEGANYPDANGQILALDSFMDFIKVLDVSFYNQLKPRFDQINMFNFDYQLCNEIITDIGYYVIGKNNNKLNANQYSAAIRTLYTNFYGLSEEEVDREVNRTIEFNKQKFERAFPTTYKINVSGEKEIYSSLDNKWEEEEITRHM